MTSSKIGGAKPQKWRLTIITTHRHYVSMHFRNIYPHLPCLFDLWPATERAVVFLFIKWSAIKYKFGKAFNHSNVITRNIGGVVGQFGQTVSPPGLRVQFKPNQPITAGFKRNQPITAGFWRNQPITAGFRPARTRSHLRSKRFSAFYAGPRMKCSLEGTARWSWNMTSSIVSAYSSQSRTTKDKASSNNQLQYQSALQATTTSFIFRF